MPVPVEIYQRGQRGQSGPSRRELVTEAIMPVGWQGGGWRVEVRDVWEDRIGVLQVQVEIYRVITERQVQRVRVVGSRAREGMTEVVVREVRRFSGSDRRSG
jgi:hypothetical protein